MRAKRPRAISTQALSSLERHYSHTGNIDSVLNEAFDLKGEADNKNNFEITRSTGQRGDACFTRHPKRIIGFKIVPKRYLEGNDNQNHC